MYVYGLLIFIIYNNVIKFNVSNTKYNLKIKTRTLQNSRNFNPRREFITSDIFLLLKSVPNKI